MTSVTSNGYNYLQAVGENVTLKYEFMGKYQLVLLKIQKIQQQMIFFKNGVNEEGRNNKNANYIWFI